MFDQETHPALTVRSECLLCRTLCHNYDGCTLQCVLESLSWEGTWRGSIETLGILVHHSVV